MSELIRHKCGATSSKVFNYHRITKHSLDRLAAHTNYGAAIHGEDNWRQGLNDSSYLLNRLDCVLCHVLMLMEEIRTNKIGEGLDHSAAIMWGGMFACEATKEQFKDKI